MSTFVEFYSIMLGFVNFKSYEEIGLIYPPKLSISQKPDEKLDEQDFNDEFLASLNCDFVKVNESTEEDGSNGDEFPLADEENPEVLEQAKIEEENLRKQKNLFKGLKFFLNREIPREPFVLALRSFSGEVSWDNTAALGCTYQESDETITHHIIDRPLVGKTYINRVYVQPQWVFDCINECMLLPVDEYLPGAVLPPHLSPFVEVSDHGYVPPEKQRLIKMKLGITEEPKEKVEVKVNSQKSEENKAKPVKVEVTKLEKKKVVERGSESSSEGEESEEEINDMKVDLDSPEEESASEESELSEGEEEKKPNKNQVFFLRFFF